MFTMWLIHALHRRSKRMSADERKAVRKLSESLSADELHGDTRHNSKKHKRRKNMADEKTAKQATDKVEDEAKETTETKVDETEKVDKSTEAESGDKDAPKADDTSAETETEAETTAPQVQEVEQQGNGIDINDLVTKDMLSQALSSMEAKFNAVVKENADLKDQLSKAQQDAKGLREKYEDSDFGNNGSKGATKADASTAYETFESYSRRFM